jgi:hypothetical protein
MEILKRLIVALSLVSLASFSSATAEPRSPSQVCFDTYLGCQGNSMKCSDPRKCQARCDQKVKQCLAKAQGGSGGKRTTSAGNGASVGAGNTKNVSGTKTGVNTNAGAASGTTINASGAKSAPAQQMPSTNPHAGGGGGTGQPPDPGECDPGAASFSYSDCACAIGSGSAINSRSRRRSPGRNNPSTTRPSS